MPTKGQKVLTDRRVKQAATVNELSDTGAVRKGMGFQAATAKVAKQTGVGQAAARRIVASAAQNASPAAKKANANLKKVPTKGSKRTKGGVYK